MSKQIAINCIHEAKGSIFEIWTHDTNKLGDAWDLLDKAESIIESVEED